MYRKLERALLSVIRRVSAAALRRALKLVERSKRYKWLQRRLQSVLKDFDRLTKAYAPIAEKLKDDLKLARELAREAKKECKDRECKKQITDLVRTMERLVGYWEGERFDKLFLEYNNLLKAKVGKIPKSHRQKLTEVRDKLIRAVERHALPKLERILRKLWDVVEDVRKKEKEAR